MTPLRVAETIDALGFRGEGSPYSRCLGLAECNLHEFAHSLTLGDCNNDDVDRILRKMTDRASDWNEIRAIAVEKLIANGIGLRVGLRALAKYAESGMKTRLLSPDIEKAVRRLMRARNINALAQAGIARITAMANK